MANHDEGPADGWSDLWSGSSPSSSPPSSPAAPVPHGSSLPADFEGLAVVVSVLLERSLRVGEAERCPAIVRADLRVAGQQVEVTAARVAKFSPETGSMTVSIDAKLPKGRTLAPAGLAEGEDPETWLHAPS